MDLNGEGVNFTNLWSGKGMPFGGSLIMMAFDIVLYGFLAYYLDSVIPSMPLIIVKLCTFIAMYMFLFTGEHGIKRSPLFCLKPSFWCPKKPIQKVSSIFI